MLTLLEFGLLFPNLSTTSGVLRSFEQWLALATPIPWLWAPPLVTDRCLSEPLPLPQVMVQEIPAPVVQEADGLEWLLRVAVLVQYADLALKANAAGGFF